MNADKLLYLYETDQIIPIQLIPIEWGLIQPRLRFGFRAVTAHAPELFSVT